MWDYSCDDPESHWAPFYPGDDVVDWHGVNVFSKTSAPNASCTTAFVAQAAAKGFPVVIGESTPRTVGAGAPWGDWFAPYFDQLLAHPAVQAFCYIDWLWTNTTRWPSWGDARIEQFPTMTGNRFRATVTDPPRNIFNGAGEAAVRALLGLAQRDS